MKYSQTSFKGDLICVRFFLPTPFDLMLSMGHFIGIGQHGNEAAVSLGYE